MGKLVNKAELSEILGISERSLTEWQDQGLPISHKGERGESNEYDTARVIAWWVAREVEKVQGETQDQRLRRVQADKIELEIAEKRGVLVHVDEVRPTWQRMVLAARQKLLGFPRRLAHLLETAPGIDGKQAILTDEIDSVLKELSQYEPGREVDSGDLPAVGSAEADDGRGMGRSEAVST